MTFHRRYRRSDNSFFFVDDDSGKVFHEDAKGNMVAETVDESQAESYALLGLSREEAKAAAEIKAGER